MEKSRDLQNLLLETVATCQLLEAGQRILVGVSGGADSMTLLHLLLNLPSEWGLKIEVAHVHHGFRGAEADAEEEYVRTKCEEWGVPCHVARFDVPALRCQRHRSAQETAREVRHTFLRETAIKIGAERIALAHTQTDRVETILWHILRGTGTEGLIGFPARNLPLIRPLYAILREETEAYCRQWSIEPRVDSSNQDLHYRRNRTRLELLPYLREHYNVEVASALLRLGEIASAENEHLEREASEALQVLILEESEHKLVLSAERLKGLSVALQRRVLRLAIVRHRGGDTDLSFEITERLRTALFANEPYHANLPNFGTWRGSWVLDSGKVHLFTTQERVPKAFWQIPLILPGTTTLPKQNLHVITMAVAEGTPTPYQHVEHKELPLSYQKASSLLLPSDAVVLPLVVRCWRAGDRMRPRGLQGSKKLQDIFTDAKVPSSERTLYPVLVDRGGEGNIWAVLGLKLAEGAIPVEAECELKANRSRIWLYLVP